MSGRKLSKTARVEALTELVERTATHLSHASVTLRRIHDELPRNASRSLRAWAALEADRFEQLAAMMSLEGKSLSLEGVGFLARYGRSAAFHVALVGCQFVVGGMLEGVGGELFERFLHNEAVAIQQSCDEITVEANVIINMPRTEVPLAGTVEAHARVHAAGIDIRRHNEVPDEEIGPEQRQRIYEEMQAEERAEEEFERQRVDGVDRFSDDAVAQRHDTGRLGGPGR